MKETNYINNLENTIINLAKEYNDLIDEKEIVEKKIEEKEKLIILYFKKIKQYYEDNGIDLNTVITNAILGGLNTLKNIKKLLTKNE